MRFSFCADQNTTTSIRPANRDFFRIRDIDLAIRLGDHGVTLLAPPGEFRTVGHEDRSREIIASRAAGAPVRLSEGEIRDTVEATWERTRKDIGFRVYLKAADTRERLSSVRFELETSAGIKADPLNAGRPVVHLTSGESFGDYPPPVFGEGLRGGTIFLGDYLVAFPLKNEKGELLASCATQWLRLWIITERRRTPFTFWIDGSAKTEAGNKL